MWKQWATTIGLTAIIGGAVVFGNDVYGDWIRDLKADVREFWAPELENVYKENIQLRAEIRKLQQDIETVSRAITQHEEQLKIVQHARPVYPHIYTRVKQNTSTKHGMQQEVQRILGDVINVKTIEIHHPQGGR